MKTKMVMKIESFSMKDGMILLSVDNVGARVVLKELVDTCKQKYGGYIKSEFSPPYRDRTLPQNNLYWVRCTELARHYNMTKKEVSLGIKWRACDEGLWELVDVPFTNKKEPKSTALANVQEMNILLEVQERIALEDGFVFDF